MVNSQRASRISATFNYNLINNNRSSYDEKESSNEDENEQKNI